MAAVEPRIEAAEEFLQGQNCKVLYWVHQEYDKGPLSFGESKFITMRPLNCKGLSNDTVIWLSTMIHWGGWSLFYTVPESTYSPCDYILPVGAKIGTQYTGAPVAANAARAELTRAEIREYSNRWGAYNAAVGKVRHYQSYQPFNKLALGIGMALLAVGFFVTQEGEFTDHGWAIAGGVVSTAFAGYFTVQYAEAKRDENRSKAEVERLEAELFGESDDSSP